MTGVTVLDTSAHSLQSAGAASDSPREIWLRESRGPYGRQRDRDRLKKPPGSTRMEPISSLQTFYEVIYAAGVDILLVGHDKIYERFAPTK